MLPAVTVEATDTRPSGGNPVVSFSEADCDVYASSLNYDPVDPMANTNGVGIYKTDEATLEVGEPGRGAARRGELGRVRRGGFGVGVRGRRVASG